MVQFWSTVNCVASLFNIVNIAHQVGLYARGVLEIMNCSLQIHHVFVLMDTTNQQFMNIKIQP